MVSEKAANIARAIRQEEHLLSLLIQEKKDSEKNPRFAHDFKTLADVLVQEVVKHDLGKEVLFTCRGVCVRGAWLERSTQNIPKSTAVSLFCFSSFQCPVHKLLH